MGELGKEGMERGGGSEKGWRGWGEGWRERPGGREVKKLGMREKGRCGVLTSASSTLWTPVRLRESDLVE